MAKSEMKIFTFNPFQENTYLIWNKDRECLVMDPGCYNSDEELELASFIEENKLKPIGLLNTHCHIDHVFGNKFVCDKYNLTPKFHKLDGVVFERAKNIAEMYGLEYNESPSPNNYLEENEIIKIGELKLKVILSPGHSPGHIIFYNENEKYIIGGDVLFKRSIGRTDLPGGNHDQLLQSIREKIYVLSDETLIFPGHGEITTIGEERMLNPFTK
jgi:hydroxyacylglutathione hydrolase